MAPLTVLIYTRKEKMVLDSVSVAFFIGHRLDWKCSDLSLGPKAGFSGAHFGVGSKYPTHGLWMSDVAPEMTWDLHGRKVIETYQPALVATIHP